ncbi:hypothetical protein [Sneathiella sp.]|uniref:hypothetical protein n=1 Tax=Sneathiella sp. TaxID=1964365 RepID=UPI0035627905
MRAEAALWRTNRAKGSFLGCVGGGNRYHPSITAPDRIGGDWRAARRAARI